MRNTTTTESLPQGDREPRDFQTDPLPPLWKSPTTSRRGWNSRSISGVKIFWELRCYRRRESSRRAGAPGRIDRRIHTQPIRPGWAILKRSVARWRSGKAMAEAVLRLGRARRASGRPFGAARLCEICKSNLQFRSRSVFRSYHCNML